MVSHSLNHVDAAWKKEAEKCGVGWILRDDKGKVKWYGAKAYPALLSSLEAEVAALSWAMRCLDNLGVGNVVFESDSQVLMKAVDNPEEWPRLTTYIADILRLQRRYLQPSFQFKGREANGYADLLASKASSLSLYSAILDCSTPEWLKPIVEREEHECSLSI